MVVWIVIALLIVFEATRVFWYDPIEKPSDRALFWANALVALGTLALAATTAWQASLTRSVLRGEDRRHQQGFIPIVEMRIFLESGAVPTLAVRFTNVGKGPALNVIAVLSGTISNVRFSYIPAAGDREGEYPPGETAFIPVSGSAYLALLPDPAAGEQYGRTVLFEKALFDAPRPVQFLEGAVSLDGISLSYRDLFDNEYETVYTDWKRQLYYLELPPNWKTRAAQ